MQVAETQAHRERVLHQVIVLGHIAHERYAESTRRRDVLTGKVEQLTQMIVRLMPPDGDDAVGRRREGARTPPQARARPNPPTASGADPTMFRLNTRMPVSRSQVHAALLAFARAHTTMPGDAMKITGAEGGPTIFEASRQGVVIGETWRSNCLRAAR